MKTKTPFDFLAQNLFYFWLLSLPFYRFSIIKTFSVDNLLAPVLMMLWLFTSPVNDSAMRRARIKEISYITILFGTFAFGQLLTIINTNELIWSKLYQLTKLSFYFFIPALYIKDLVSFKKANSVLIVLALAGCISALLVSLGLLHLPVERFSPSRIGIEDLPKAIGLFGAYGDMALLISYTFLLTISSPKKDYLFGYGSKKVKAFVIFIIFLGILGLQSRNIVLTLMTAIFFYNLIKATSKMSAKFRTMALGLSFFLTTIALAVLLFFADDFINLLSQWGGKQAESTAMGRLEQYQIALKLISESPVIGVKAVIYEMHTSFIDSVHNLWLKVGLQGGLISLIPLILLLINAFKKALKNLAMDSPPEKYVISVFIICMFVSTQFNPSGTIVFWVMLSVATSLSWVYGHEPVTDIRDLYDRQK